MTTTYEGKHIRVSIEVYNLLKKLKLVKAEPFNSIIERLIKNGIFYL